MNRGIDNVEHGTATRVLSHWFEFVSLIHQHHANAPAYIYRGQADDWPLLSTLDRFERRYPKKRDFIGNDVRYFDCPPVSREVHLNAFKECARARSDVPDGAPDDEWWTVAQHHGLATPILDWTYSPFVAMFFAFEHKYVTDYEAEKIVEPAYRVVYRASWHLVGDEANDASKPRVFVPKIASTPRLLNQESVFVMMPPQLDLTEFVKAKYPDESSASNRFARCVLEKIRIKSDDRIECLKFLNKMRINRLTMYPDLGGSAEYVNAMWELDFDTSIGSIDSDGVGR